VTRLPLSGYSQLRRYGATVIVLALGVLAELRVENL
jgi:hypothetical protein